MYKKTSWKLLKIKRSPRKFKKYQAIIEHKPSGKTTAVHFGDNRYATYHDKTGLNLYKTHGDASRRASYRKRHEVYRKPGYWTPAELSWSYLW